MKPPPLIRGGLRLYNLPPLLKVCPVPPVGRKYYIIFKSAGVIAAPTREMVFKRGAPITSGWGFPTRLQNSKGVVSPKKRGGGVFNTYLILVKNGPHLEGGVPPHYMSPPICISRRLYPCGIKKRLKKNSGVKLQKRKCG